MFKKIIKITIPIIFLLGVIIGIILCVKIEGLNNNWLNFVVIPLGTGAILSFLVLGFWFIFRSQK